MQTPLRATESVHREWPRDLIILSLWFFSVLVFSVFKTPSLLAWSGSAFIILYGAWIWPPMKAAVLYLIVAWFYSSVSLVPSGLYWLALYSFYIVVSVAQHRFMIRNALQFTLVIGLLAFFFEGFQAFLVAQLYPGRTLSWTVIGAVMMTAASHSVVALLLYPSVERWVVD